MTVKQEFIELLTASHRAHGFDEATARVVAVLYAEPHELSLDELAQRTGYSLSSVSTSMKLMENFGLVQRIKKPKSRKAYFYVSKDLIGTFIELSRKNHHAMLTPALEKLPELIARAGKEKSDVQSIMKEYYKQMVKIDEIIRKQLQLMERAHRELMKNS